MLRRLKCSLKCSSKPNPLEPEKLSTYTGILPELLTCRSNESTVQTTSIQSCPVDHSTVLSSLPQDFQDFPQGMQLIVSDPRGVNPTLRIII